MSIMKDSLDSILSQVVDEEAWEKEAERLYLKSRLETYEERIKILEAAINDAVDLGQHQISPFMFGFTVGMRRAFAFIENRQVTPLRKPPLWVNDPQHEKMLKLITQTRRHIRRQTARLMWTLYSHFYKYNLYPLDIPQYHLEKRVMEYIKNMLAGITAAYKVREMKTKYIKLMGVDYEKVKNAETIEDRWV